MDRYVVAHCIAAPNESGKFYLEVQLSTGVLNSLPIRKNLTPWPPDRSVSDDNGGSTTMIRSGQSEETRGYRRIWANDIRTLFNISACVVDDGPCSRIPDVLRMMQADEEVRVITNDHGEMHMNSGLWYQNSLLPSAIVSQD